VIEHELGLPIVPSSRERWMYEDKYRLRDWLVANEIPHPRTWVFTRREEARAFAVDCALPIVFKTGFGGAAAGVRIVRTRRALSAIVRKAFGRGHVPSGHDHRDREWGCLLLQEYLPEVREWRMVRIGDSYFGHPKGRVGDFHSGSKRVEWDLPSSRLLDLLHRVTEVGAFRSMDVDVFETPDGRLLVNELQTVFGASTSVDQIRRDGVPGRMVRSTDAGAWHFETGDFARNACANERLRDALNRLFHFSLPVPRFDS
jgi:glutathione synthase/RimK-type ligase-like ATP-grasp enzyme